MVRNVARLVSLRDFNGMGALGLYIKYITYVSTYHTCWPNNVSSIKQQSITKPNIWKSSVECTLVRIISHNTIFGVYIFFNISYYERAIISKSNKIILERHNKKPCTEEIDEFDKTLYGTSYNRLCKQESNERGRNLINTVGICIVFCGNSLTSSIKIYELCKSFSFNVSKTTIKLFWVNTCIEKNYVQ